MRSMLMPALLLALALLLFQQVRRNHLLREGGGSLSMRTAERTDGASAGMDPGKSSKVSQRPERHETEAKIPTAEPVRGQPGFVYHPVNGTIVDVTGIPAGLMVQESGAMFVIPKMGYVITSEAYNKAVSMTAGGVGAVNSGEGDAGVTWSFGVGSGPSVVSCHPGHWETRWDDGTPFVPDGLPPEMDSIDY